MKNLLSTHYTAGAFNFGMLILRIVSGGLMIKHGFDKLQNFDQTSAKMMNFMGLGSKTSAALVVFAEFFCAGLILIGLLTRLATIPLIICMTVALFIAHKGDFFGDGQVAALYLGAYVVLLFTGPGKISLDGMIGK